MINPNGYFLCKEKTTKLTLTRAYISVLAAAQLAVVDTCTEQPACIDTGEEGQMLLPEAKGRRAKRSANFAIFSRKISEERPTRTIQNRRYLENKIHTTQPKKRKK
jgi:hypothetical protein